MYPCDPKERRRKTNCVVCACRLSAGFYLGVVVVMMKKIGTYSADVDGEMGSLSGRMMGYRVVEDLAFGITAEEEREREREIEEEMGRIKSFVRSRCD